MDLDALIHEFENDATKYEALAIRLEEQFVTARWKAECAKKAIEYLRKSAIASAERGK